MRFVRIAFIINIMSLAVFLSCFQKIRSDSMKLTLICMDYYLHNFNIDYSRLQSGAGCLKPIIFRRKKAVLIYAKLPPGSAFLCI